MDPYMQRAEEAVELGKKVDRNNWIPLSKINSKLEKQTGWKLHVSIHPDDYDKIAPVLAKILEYRDKYNIGAKIATKKWAEEIINHGTQRGKTITIYVPEERAEIAKRLVDDIERILLSRNIKTHHPAPNDEIVGKTGAVGVAYTQFGGKDIPVPREYQHIYGETIRDRERRNDPRLAVPLWKEKEFYGIFGKIPETAATYRAILTLERKSITGRIRGAIRRKQSEKSAFERLKSLHLEKKKHVNDENMNQSVELRPGMIVSIRDASTYRITDPGRGSETAIAQYLLKHAGWQSGMGAPIYILSSEGYVKIDANDATFRKAMKSVEHLHSDPHILIEKASGTLRIHNIGRKPLLLERRG